MKTDSNKKMCKVCNKLLRYFNKSGYCRVHRPTAIKNICISCSKIFISKNCGAKTCSSICRSRVYAKMHRKPLLIHNCLICSTKFTTKNPNNKFCSKKCLKRFGFLRDRKNIDERIKHNMRSRLFDAIKGKNRSVSATRDMGCSLEELKQHLQSQFKDNMSWNNYGKNGWHIDHIRPMSSFNLQDRQEFLRACHYTNLQPLWAHDNLSKGDRYEQ